MRVLKGYKCFAQYKMKGKGVFKIPSVSEPVVNIVNFSKQKLRELTALSDVTILRFDRLLTFTGPFSEIRVRANLLAGLLTTTAFY